MNPAVVAHLDYRNGEAAVEASQSGEAAARTCEYPGPLRSVGSREGVAQTKEAFPVAAK